MENYLMNLKQVDEGSADERQKPIIQNAIKKNGGLPNMYANMVNSPGLLETYLHGYEIFRKESGFSAVEQEVIFLTISYLNDCNYCMAAHSVIADKISKVPAIITEAIRQGKDIAEQKLQTLSAFTKEMFVTRGRPAKEAVEQFLNSGYSEKQMLEIVLALAVKTLSNYSNHIFETSLDNMFKGREWVKS